MRITNIQKKKLIDTIWATELLCPSLFHCHAPDYHIYTIEYRFAPSYKVTIMKVADDGYTLEKSVITVRFFLRVFDTYIYRCKKQRRNEPIVIAPHPLNLFYPLCNQPLTLRPQHLKDTILQG